MDLQLRGKRALVTGGSRGIGLATAKALAREGCAVAIVARGEAALREAAAGISSDGATALPVVADARDDAQVRAAVEHAAGELGGIDILVNAAATPAGGSPPPTLHEVQDDEVRAEVETKVLGYLRFARATAPHMIQGGWGRIVSISGLAARSASSIVGSMRNVAVSAMTKNLADQLGPHGINVTVVHPAMTETERTPGMLAAMAERSGISEEEARSRLAAGVSIGRLVTAAEIADVIAFLCSPRSVAINGDAVVVGGGAVGPIYY
ncbi:MAG: SDR family NAD(P)-dependent oxidoreductase [Candidatus Dormibacteraeota bacterium]|nr:SDR family NAD(P)-dependent oxidoreductase [Candidatus Dormibacteraeota bacterium]MBO0743400.1 SDR family NAD(P)-dependent oxidoreductase [Candidatus Dormibacteraeota bacterium]